MTFIFIIHNKKIYHTHIYIFIKNKLIIIIMDWYKILCNILHIGVYLKRSCGLKWLKIENSMCNTLF